MGASIYGLVSCTGRKYDLRPYIAIAGTVDIGRGLARGYVNVLTCWSICILSTSRMAALAIPLMVVIGPSRISSIPRLLCAFMFVVSACLLFNVPFFQSYMFRDSQDSFNDLLELDETVVDTSGRLTTWPMYIETAQNPFF